MFSIALEDWLAGLPPSLALNIESPFNALPHILMMHLSHAWLAILLYRPFYRPFAGLSSSEKSDGAGISQPSRAAWAVKVCLHHILPLMDSNVITLPFESFTFSTYGTLTTISASRLQRLYKFVLSPERPTFSRLRVQGRARAKKLNPCQGWTSA
jgi:hypothetical protein